MTELERLIESSQKPSFPLKDEVAGPVLPADKKYLAKAIEQFDLPPVPAETLLKRHVPSVDQLMASARLLIQHSDKVNARHLLRQILSIHSFLPEAIELMIECVGSSECGIDEQLKLRATLCRVQPSFRNFLRFSQAHYENREYRVSQQILEQAFLYTTENAEDLFDAHKLFGNIALRLSDFDAAEEFYNKAFAINSRSAALLINIATLEAQRSNWTESFARYDEAFLATSSKDAENRAKCLVGKYLAQKQMPNGKEDVSMLEAALELKPSDRTAVHLYCLWAYQHEKIEKAAAILLTYLDLNPMDDEMSLIAAQFFSLMGDFGTAAIEVEKAVLCNPGNESALDLIVQLDSLNAEVNLG